MVVIGGRSLSRLSGHRSGRSHNCCGRGRFKKCFTQFFAALTKKAAPIEGATKDSARPATAPSGEPVPAQLASISTLAIRHIAKDQASRKEGGLRLR